MMFRFLPYILKSLWGHRTRTLLTVSGAAVALFVFTCVAAVGDGLNRLTSDAGADRALIVFQANRFCPFTSSLPQDYDRDIGKIEGVRDVIPIKVYTNNCRASLDVIVFHGVPPDKLQSARQLNVTQGNFADFERLRDGALVGQAVARRRGISTGDRFSIGGVTVTVAGIFTAPYPAEEDFIYTQLEFLQRQRGKNEVGRVTQFEVLLDESADPETVAAAIDAAFRGGPVATDTRTKGVFQAASVADLTELVGFAHYLGVACVGLVLMLVAATAVMSVQDRIREHGVLRTIGVSDPRVFGLILGETLLVSLAGGAVGVFLALAALALGHFSMGTEGVIIAFEPSFVTAMWGLAAAFAAGVLAGIVPAWQATRSEIVAALRHV
jgi:putative ABC transport system permease protein